MPSTVPRGSKRSGTRKNKLRGHSRNNDNSLLLPHGSSKSAIGRNRFSPFQRSASRRDSRSSEDSITLTTNYFRPLQQKTPRRESISNEEAVDLTTGHIAPIERVSSEIKMQRNNETMTIEDSQLLNQRSGGIIQNGINYLMMPFQLLHSCVFGTSAMPTETTTAAMQNLSINDDKIKENENTGKNAKKEEVSTEADDQVKSTTDPSVPSADKNKSLAKKGGSELPSSVKNEECGSSFGEVCAEGRREGEESPSSSLKKKEEYQVSSTLSTPSCEKSTDDESADEMFTAAEDSDSSNDQWTIANSVMNMSIDSDGGVERSSFDSSSPEEPMDISMEEIDIDIKSSTFKSPNNNRSYGSSESPSKYESSTSVSSYSEESSSSVDDEIARIFQRKCYSSGDESSSSSPCISNDESILRRMYEESKDFRADSRKTNKERVRDNQESKSTPRSRSIADDGKRRVSRRSAVEEQKKTASSDDDTKGKKISRRSEDREKEFERNYMGESSKRRKISRDSKTPVRSFDSTPRSSKKSSQSIRMVNRSSQTSSRNLRSAAKNSPTPVKKRRPSLKDVHARSKATQTTNIYSNVIPEIMFHTAALCYFRNPCCRYFGPDHQIFLYYPEEMDQDFDYVADNEDSYDGSLDFAQNGYSSGSLSPRSVIDHYYEEPSTSSRNTPNQPRQIGTIPRELWLDHRGHSSRTPPGFPQSERSDSPEYQCSCEHPYCYILSSMTPEGQCAYGLTTHIYPRAPTPMRHMYYNFPEFMMPNTKQNEQRTNFLVPYSVDLRDCFERELPTIMNVQPQP